MTRPTSNPAAVRAALDTAQHLSESSDRRHGSSWAAAQHVGDISALVMVALADSDADSEPEPLAA